MKRNIAYKADGTEETGKKIIDALMSLGGKNKYNYGCQIENEFCFLDNDGNITFDEKLPFSYELKSLDEQQRIANEIDDLKTQMMELLSKL